MAIEVLLSEVTESILRAGDFHATKGGNGVALPTDLQVRALDVPGTSVQVVRGPSGSAALVDPRPSRGAQTYITVASETELVPVPATDSSGGKTRYIIQNVDDGNVPGAYFACVDSLAEYVLVPHVVLAKIVQPASTATIQPAMVTDMRKVANPRSETVVRPRATITQDTETVDVSAPEGEWFPTNGGGQYIDIPEWAVRVQIRAEWFMLKYGPGDEAGYHWVEFGPFLDPSRLCTTQKYRWRNPGTEVEDRRDWTCVDDVYVPPEIRGTTQAFVMKARHTGGTLGTVAIDYLSGTSLEARFLEVADPSSS